MICHILLCECAALWPTQRTGPLYAVHRLKKKQPKTYMILNYNSFKTSLKLIRASWLSVVRISPRGPVLVTLSGNHQKRGLKWRSIVASSRSVDHLAGPGMRPHAPTQSIRSIRAYCLSLLLRIMCNKCAHFLCWITRSGGFFGTFSSQ